MFHLVYRFRMLMFRQLRKTPVLVNSGMKKLLIDRGQLVSEDAVQVLYNGCVALH